MMTILKNRLDRLLRLRNIAIEEGNLLKKCQSERLIKELTNKLDILYQFSLN